MNAMSRGIRSARRASSTEGRSPRNSQRSVRRCTTHRDRDAGGDGEQDHEHGGGEHDAQLVIGGRGVHRSDDERDDDDAYDVDADAERRGADDGAHHERDVRREVRDVERLRAHPSRPRTGVPLAHLTIVAHQSPERCRRHRPKRSSVTTTRPARTCSAASTAATSSALAAPCTCTPVSLTSVGRRAAWSRSAGTCRPARRNGGRVRRAARTVRSPRRGRGRRPAAAGRRPARTRPVGPR